MSNIQTGAERMPHDLSHLGFLAGQIGRLITISTTPVIAGDSFEMDAVGALRLSPLRRGLAIDSTVDMSKKFKIAEGQWYRYAPSYVSPAYHLLEGFPFIQEPPSGDLQERVLIRHHDYDQCFQSVQLLQWNSQVKFNVTVYRNLPTTRDSIMTS